MIFITAPIHPLFTDTLQSKGLVFREMVDITYDELLHCIDEATGLVVSTRIPIDDKMIEAASKLQWIGRLGSGMEHIDVQAATRKNIQCISSPEGNSNAVAEHALGLLLNLLRNISSSSREVINHHWIRSANMGRELASLRVGIIGYGNTGSRFASLLCKLGLDVYAHDKYKKGFGQDGVRECELSFIQAHCNVISFHLPYSTETHHYANANFFGALQQHPIILNTSRGNVLDTGALLHALDAQKIAGAGLDVLENENLSSYTQEQQSQLQQLLSHKNVLVTPHIAGYTHEAFYKMSKVLLEKLRLIE
jgi:D-3-phosphoglycerate dehydrogenase